MLKKVSFSLFAKLFSALVMFLVSVLLARYLGVEMFGYYSLFVTIVPIASYAFVFGQDQYLVSRGRFSPTGFSAFKSKIIVCRSLVLSSSLFFLGLVFFYLFESLFGFEKDINKIIFLFGMCAGFVLSIRRVFVAFFRVSRKEILAILPESVVQPALLIVFIYFYYYLFGRMQLLDVFYMYFLSALLSLIFIILFVSEAKSFRLQLSMFSLQPSVKSGYLFASLTLVEVFILYFDRFVVFHIHGADSLAIYQVSLRVVEIILIFESAYLLISMPKIAKLYKERNYSDANTVLIKQSKIIFVFNIIFSMIALLFAKEILSIFGNGFVEGAVILQSFALANVLYSAIGPSTFILTVVGLERKALYSAILSMFIFLAITVVFHEQLTLIGIVLVKIILEFLRRIYCSYLLYKNGLYITVFHYFRIPRI